MELQKKSSSVAKGGLTTGIIGTSLGALALLGTGANGLGNLVGGLGGRNVGVGQTYMDLIAMQALMNSGCGCGCHATACESDHMVTRYDADKDAKIAHLETQVALRDSNTYTDQKMIELYKDINARLRGLEGQIGQQAVINQANADNFKLVSQQIDCCCEKQTAALEAEKAARCCGDNSIVNYANATFYPQMIANMTVGTTARAQETWNPVTNCGCCNN